MFQTFFCDAREQGGDPSCAEGSTVGASNHSIEADAGVGGDLLPRKLADLAIAGGRREPR